MVMLYTVRNVCQLYEVSATTLKNWADMASPFLSEVARPPKGKHRSFTYEDLRVFSVIKSSPDYDSAFLALSNGQRGDVPDMHNEYSIVMESKEQLMLLQNQVMQLQARVRELEGEHDGRIRAEGQRDMLKEQLREAQDKIVQLELKLQFDK